MIAGIIPESPEAVARGIKARKLADTLLAQPALSPVGVDPGTAESAVKNLSPEAWDFLSALAGVRIPSRRTQCLTASLVRSTLEHRS